MIEGDVKALERNVSAILVDDRRLFDACDAVEHGIEQPKHRSNLSDHFDRPKDRERSKENHGEIRKGQSALYGKESAGSHDHAGCHAKDQPVSGSERRERALKMNGGASIACVGGADLCEIFLRHVERFDHADALHKFQRRCHSFRLHLLTLRSNLDTALLHVIVEWETQKHRKDKDESQPPVKNKNAEGNRRHRDETGDHAVQQMHAIVLEIIEIVGHRRCEIAEAVVVEKTHRHAPQPVAETHTFARHKFETSRALQSVGHVLEQDTQKRRSDEEQ